MGMDKNYNQAVIYKLARRNLKSNKARNLMACIIITLSTALVFAFVLYVWGSKEEKLALLKNTCQVCYKNITLDQAEILKKDKRTKWSGLGTFVGAKKVGNTHLKISWQDKAYMDEDNIPYYGNLPSGENEIMISQEYLERIGKKQNQPGDTIKLDLGDGIIRNCKISAISTKHSKAANSQHIYVSLPFAMELKGIKGESIDTDIIINNALDMDMEEVTEQIMDMAASAGITEDQVEINNSFFMQAQMSNLEVSDIITLVLVILLVLIAAGIVIYNIFYISITGKIREYGQMQTIGMTKKQIKSMVLYEGIMLALTGTVPGLLIGGIMGYILVPGGFKARNCIISAIFCMFLSFISVCISVKKPGKTAASFSPVDALRYTGYTQVPNSMVKKQRAYLIKLKNKPYHLTPVYLASLNFKRSRKKSLLTMCSLVISGVMLGTITSYIVSYDPASSVEFSFPTGEYQISLDTPSGFGGDTSLEGNMKMLSSLQSENFMEELETELKNIKGVTRVQSWRYIMGSSVTLAGEESSFPLAGLNGISEQDFELLKEMDYEGPGSYQELLEKPGLVITNEYTSYLRENPLLAGDIVNIIIYNGNGERIETQIPVAATVKIIPWQHKNRTKRLPVSLIGSSFMMPCAVLDQWTGMNTVYGYELSTEPEMTKSVGEILEETYGMEENLYISSKPGLREYYEQEYFSTKIILYSLAVFLIIFAIINLANTIITNLYSRKKELGILQAVGMTDGQLKDMLKRETLNYTGISAACTLVFGGLLGYALVITQMQMGIDMIYSFPWIPVFLYISLMFLVQQYLACYSIKLLKKENLVERIKNTE